MQKRMTLIFSPLLFSLAAFSHVALAKSKTNIIYLIGDGMGVSYTSAYRYFDNSSVVANSPFAKNSSGAQSAQKKISPSIFDQTLTGSSSTYPDDDHATVTDSAAAATALAAQVKTFNGAIGVDKNHHNVPTILDLAKEHGYLTGIAVTSQVNHATPAAFVAHVDSRSSYNDIADQYFDLRINGKPKIDLLLGGGQDYFVRKDRDLIKEFKELGYSYESDLNKLSSIKKIPAIGLFAPVGMTSALDSDHPLRLAEMTDKALSLLAGKPFFLMLEASQIDWCGHANDIACAMAEMRDMAETMKIIKRFIDKNPDTIFVATADHSTGGLSLGTHGEYQWLPDVVKGVKASAEVIAGKLLTDRSNWKNQWRNLTGIELTAAEVQQLQELLNSATDENKNKLSARVADLSSGFIDKYSGTGWTTHGHTGEDVQIFSYGKNKNNFSGAMDNVDIPKKLATYITQ